MISKGGAVVKAFPFNQCGLGSTPSIFIIHMWLAFVVG